MERGGELIPFSLTTERRQELLLEAAWHEQERIRILGILGMHRVSVDSVEDWW